MIRRRNDLVKPGRGIDGSKGEDFSKRYAQDPGTVEPDCAANERSYSPISKKHPGDRWGEVGVDQQNRMRNVENFQFRAKTRSVASLVLDDAGEVNGGYSGKLPNVDMDN